MRRVFRQVDVFTAEPLQGNLVAVASDASDLDTSTMQRFAHWTDSSETTFVLPPEVRLAFAAPPLVRSGPVGGGTVSCVEATLELL